jgi:NADPH:quinone reductase-like Zn-dependent oxidoreductase
MMKAVRFSQFGGPEVLEIVDLPDPHPGPGQVRIAVRAAGVNPSDWKKRKGLMDGELPQTMGHEAAGVVDELGEGVADVAVGDRVFGFSAEGAAQAELAVLSYYAPIPSSLGFPGAAAPVPPTRTTCARWGPSPSPTVRASSSGFARSRRSASTRRSTSPEAASCPGSSSSRAARSTS